MYIMIFILFYADDTAILAGTPDDLQNCIRAFEHYCSEWRLGINVHKIIAYTDEPTAYKDEPIVYKDKPIVYKDKPTAYKGQFTAYKVKATAYKDKTTTYKDNTTIYK